MRSYVLDALLDQPQVTKSTSDIQLIARLFLKALEQAQEEDFPSVGYGRDHRYHSPNLTGSALFHQDFPVHAAFLTLEESTLKSSPATMSSLRRRRHFRGEQP